MIGRILFIVVCAALAIAGAYTGYWPFTGLFGGMLVAFLAFLGLFSMRSEDKIIEANANNGNNARYFIKKYQEADVDKMKSSLSLAGLAISLGFVLLTLNWSSRPEEVADLGTVVIPEDMEVLPPPSVQKPPPPPPPPPPPKLEVVDDEEVLEEEPEIAEVEADEETEIEVQEIEEEAPEVVNEEPEEEEEPEEPQIFQIVEEMPSYPGGEAEMMKFIYGQIKYPPIARENNIEGLVVVSFVVYEDGTIKDMQVRRDIGGGCGEEAMRVVKKMPKWKPGKQRGKAVRVSYNLPIRFKLE